MGKALGITIGGILGALGAGTAYVALAGSGIDVEPETLKHVYDAMNHIQNAPDFEARSFNPLTINDGLWLIHDGETYQEIARSSGLDQIVQQPHSSFESIMDQTGKSPKTLDTIASYFDFVEQNKEKPLMSFAYNSDLESQLSFPDDENLESLFTEAKNGELTLEKAEELRKLIDQYPSLSEQMVLLPTDTMTKLLTNPMLEPIGIYNLDIPNVEGSKLFVVNEGFSQEIGMQAFPTYNAESYQALMDKIDNPDADKWKEAFGKLGEAVEKATSPKLTHAAMAAGGGGLLGTGLGYAASGKDKSWKKRIKDERGTSSPDHYLS